MRRSSQRRRSRHPRQVFRTSAVRSLGRLHPVALEAGTVGGTKTVSGLLFVLLCGALCYFFYSYTFYVYDVRVTGARVLSFEQVFQASGVDEVSVFYLKPAEIEARLEQLPWVREAHVRCTLPDRVHIALQEREAALVWERDGKSWGIDDQGMLLPLTQVPHVALWVEDHCSMSMAERPGSALVASALAIREALPGVSRLVCDSAYGFVFPSPGGYDVRLGEGDIGQKVSLWQTLEARLSAGGVQPLYVDLRFPRSPCYGLNQPEGHPAPRE